MIILCGYVAIEAMQGPVVPFSYGRVDLSREEGLAKYGAKQGGCPFGDGKHNPCGSRLPAADLGKSKANAEYAEPRLREEPTINAVRGTFQRMGFTDKETVCLIVFGHQFGRCHPDVSGYENAWYPFAPTHWNVGEAGLGFLSGLLMGEDKGKYKEVLSSEGKRQYEMDFGGNLSFACINNSYLICHESNLNYHDLNTVNLMNVTLHNISQVGNHLCC